MESLLDIARRRIWPAVFCLLLVAPLMLLSGCLVFGAIASKTVTVKVKPHYVGLTNQSVAVMVWAPKGVQIDYPELQLQIAQSLNKKLQSAQAAKAVELVGTQFPPDKGPEAMYAIQQNYPMLMAEPIVKVAPRLGITRLIYIEVEDFSLNNAEVTELWKGTLSARVQVVEVTQGVGHTGLDERASMSFPTGPGGREGDPTLGQMKTEVGTIDGFTTEVLKKFVTYEE